MKIITLTAENIKKLQAVEITPTGNIVTIAGRNEQGKTSILDAIWWALAGTGNITSKPIRKGETKARIKLNLGDIVVERKFTEGNSILTVESSEGARFGSPQKMLDALLGELCFDPLAFTKMPAKEQFEELRRIAKVDCDIEKLDGLNKSEFDKRTEVNRDAKALRARADAMAVLPGLPESPVDESELLDKVQAAADHNAGIETRKARREAMAAQILIYRDSAAKFKADAQALLDQAAETIAKADADQAKLDGAETLPAPIDVTALRDKINAAKATNAAITQRDQRAKILAEAAEKEKQSAEFTASMEARTKAKNDAIAAAKMPVEGLGLGDGHVTLDGIPFDQASAAQKLRTSMAIAMAANPKLRVIRIVDGSLLDDDHMAEIAALAEANDFQVWVERVDSSGKIGIVIEDGQVVAVNDVPATVGEV